MTPSKTLLHLAVALTFLSWLPATFARTITLSLNFTKLQYSAFNPNYAGNTYYTVAVLVSSDTQPLTYDEVDSPNTSFSGTETGYGEYLFGDMESALANVTNGVWTLTVNKGDPSQQQYTFTVSVNGLTNGSFPQVQITEPVDGSTGIATNSAFTWTGPDNWDGVDLLDHSLDYSFYAPGGFSPPVNSWQNPPDAYLGTNEFEVTYTLAAAPWVAISTPVDSQSQPISSWMAGANLDDFAQSLFVTTTNPTVLVGGHTLFAHYTFTNDSSTFDLGDDSSPAGNGMNDSYSYWGPVHVASTNAVVNGSAVQFFGTSCMTPDDIVLANYDNLLAGSFSFSAWIDTTNSVGNDSDDAISGASIFWAYDDHNGTNDAIPLAITGDDAAFSVRDHLGNTTTIHSTTAVDDGVYHLVTVTRDQVSGLMSLYVDGQIQASAVGTTDPLNGNNYFISLGGTTLSSYTGLLDDMQVYSGVLSASDVAALYANPGDTIPDTAAPSDGLAAHYDFSEGTVLAPDVSGNGNNIVFAGNFGGNGPVISTNAIGELGSVYFDGGSFLTAPTNLLTTLAGDFSISLWLNTTQDVDYAGDDAYNGAGVISAYIPNEVTNDIVPIALTGGQVAFNTESTYDDTLTSMASVNDGSWHHIVVCRNQLTGEKDIYVDGQLDTSDTDTTLLLNAPQLLTIGAIADASNPDPASPENTGYNGYQGLLDDIQIYNRVLGANDVAFLYAHPGITVGETVVPPSPALLGNLSVAAGGIQFSFQTMSSHTYTVQSTTNLLTGSWINVTNFAGDGTVKQFTSPTTNSPTQFFRVETQ